MKSKWKKRVLMLLAGAVLLLAMPFCAAAEDEPNPNAYELKISADKVTAIPGEEITYELRLRRTKDNLGKDPIELLRFEFAYDNQKLAYVSGTADIDLPNLQPENQGFTVGGADGNAYLRLEALGETSGWNLEYTSSWQETPVVAELHFRVLDWNAPNSDAADMLQLMLKEDGESVITNGEYRASAKLTIYNVASIDINDIRLKFMAESGKSIVDAPLTAYVKPYDSVLYTDVYRTTPLTAGLPAARPAEGYLLLSQWNTHSDGSGTAYVPGKTYTSNKIFYPVVKEIKDAQIVLETVDNDPANNPGTQVISGLTITRGKAEIHFTDGVREGMLISGDVSFTATAATGYEIWSVRWKMPGGEEQYLTPDENGGYAIPQSAITKMPITLVAYTRLHFTVQDISYFTDPDITDPQQLVFRPFSMLTGGRTLVLLRLPEGVSGVTVDRDDPFAQVFAFPTDPAPYPGYTHGVLLNLSGADAADPSTVLALLHTLLRETTEPNAALTYDYNANGLLGARLLDVQAAYDFSARNTVYWRPTAEMILKCDVVGTYINHTPRNGSINWEDVQCFLHDYALPLH